MGQQVEIYGAAIVQMVYGYMDADACRKRHRNYVKRQKRAAGKRALLEWRSVEMHADEYREGQERRRQKAESTRKPQTPTASGYSRRFENEWRAFEKKYRGRYEYQAKNQSYARSENAADTEDPTSGATGGTYDREYGESESARYRHHFWSSTWRGVGGGGADWDYGANSRWETPYQSSTRNEDNKNIIGSPADRLVLGLSPAGFVSVRSHGIQTDMMVIKSLWLRQNSSVLAMLIVLCGSCCKQKRNFSRNSQLQVLLRMIFLLDLSKCDVTILWKFNEEKRFFWPLKQQFWSISASS